MNAAYLSFVNNSNGKAYKRKKIELYGILVAYHTCALVCGLRRCFEFPQRKT